MQLWHSQNDSYNRTTTRRYLGYRYPIQRNTFSVLRFCTTNATRRTIRLYTLLDGLTLDTYRNAFHK